MARHGSCGTLNIPAFTGYRMTLEVVKLMPIVSTGLLMATVVLEKANKADAAFPLAAKEHTPCVQHPRATHGKAGILATSQHTIIVHARDLPLAVAGR